ncbi:MAG: hypothetical protein V1800_15075 [Candidatus Latescibacterota bacterium]
METSTLREDSQQPSGYAPAHLGSYYDATVPETLDLAERARLGLNHLTSIIREEQDYEMCWIGSFRDHPGSDLPSPVLTHRCCPLQCCQPKCIEAMVMARVMSGSQQNLAIETRMVQMMVSHIGEEGIYWIPKYAGKPWLGPEEFRPHAHVPGQARMIEALMAWHQYTGNPAWAEKIDRMVDGIDRVLLAHKNDYAYFPVHGWMEDRGEYYGSCYIQGRGWKSTAEPADEKSGEEGSLFNHQGHTPGALTNWYRLSGNKQALRVAGELVRFLTKEKFWADWQGGEYPGVLGAQHAHWQGHFYGHINTLRSILEYGIVTNDVTLKQFVRDGYEWARQPWLIAQGGFGANGQSCATPRLIGLAIELSDEGIGDYWEDVDLYIRNHGTEMQFTPEDIPFLKHFGQRGITPEQAAARDSSVHAIATTENVIEASMGAFSVDPFKYGWALCCSPWGVKGLYYAWEGTIRYANGTARINLLLNRASPWMDIDSFLPYQGKVVLRNKTAREAYVRIPLWADKERVGCEINDRMVSPEWFGRYLRIEHLKAGDTVTLQFPVVERTEIRTTEESLLEGMHGWPGSVPRTFSYKGNTLIKISPSIPGWPLGEEDWHPYRGRAEKYRADQAPMSETKRFVTPSHLAW